MNEWTDKEIKILKDNVNESYGVLLELLPNRTLIAIIGRKDKLKLKRKSSFYWSEEEDNYLVQNYHKKFIHELTQKLNKSQDSIHARRIRLIKKGIIFLDKKPFFSKYWKGQYKNNKDLVKKHKKAIGRLWKDKKFRKKHRNSIKDKFSDPLHLSKHKKQFLKRRNSSSFRKKQSKAVSEMMKKRHNDPIEHKKMLMNLRRNPSNQQLLVVNYFKKRFGQENVGCNDWDILEGKMEVDIPIYHLKIAIEWDGEYWHSKIKGVEEKDDRKNKELIKRGWKVIRILARSTPPMTNNEVIKKADLILKTIDNKEFDLIKLR